MYISRHKKLCSHNIVSICCRIKHLNHFNSFETSSNWQPLNVLNVKMSVSFNLNDAIYLPELQTW